jgi:hypothetical protein
MYGAGGTAGIRAGKFRNGSLLMEVDLVDETQNDQVEKLAVESYFPMD